MQSSDWLTIALWSLGGLGTVVATLMGVLAYFFKRLVDQFDSTRQVVHSLRNELHALHTKFRLFKVEVRLLLKHVGIKPSEVDELIRATEEDDEDDDNPHGVLIRP